MYELGTDETKAVLVDGLVGTLSEGKMANAQKFTLDSDDKVFEPGALGQTKEGAGVYFITHCVTVTLHLFAAFRSFDLQRVVFNRQRSQQA